MFTVLEVDTPTSQQTVWGLTSRRVGGEWVSTDKRGIWGTCDYFHQTILSSTSDLSEAGGLGRIRYVVR